MSHPKGQPAHNRVDVNPGDRFGKWVLLHETRPKIYPSGDCRRAFLCHCDCGREKEVLLCHLRDGKSQTCGACTKKFPFTPLGAQRQFFDGEPAQREVYRSYKRRALRKGQAFELSLEEFLRITAMPCCYCGVALSNLYTKPGAMGQFRYSGIDRWDNAKGYVEDNCVACCKKCNLAKGKGDLDEFIAWVKRLSEHLLRPPRHADWIGLPPVGATD